MQEEMKAICRGDCGELSIAIPPTVYRDLLLNHFERYAKEYPDVKLNIYEVVSQTAIQLLEEGTVELALINLMIERPDRYEILPLRKENFHVLLPDGSELMKKKSLTFADLSNTSVAIPRSYVKLLEEQAKLDGVTLNVKAITSSTQGAYEVAKVYQIPCIAPLAQQEKLNNARMRPLKFEGNRSLQRSLIWKKDKELAKTSKNFLAILTEDKA